MIQRGAGGAVNRERRSWKVAFLGAQELAPHTGHVSNFRHPVSPLIEPMVAHCFESDPCEVLARVHDRHPVWTRLELAKGTRDSRDPPVAAVSEQPLRWERRNVKVTSVFTGGND